MFLVPHHNSTQHAYYAAIYMKATNNHVQPLIDKRNMQYIIFISYIYSNNPSLAGPSTAAGPSVSVLKQNRLGETIHRRRRACSRSRPHR